MNEDELGQNRLDALWNGGFVKSAQELTLERELYKKHFEEALRTNMPILSGPVQATQNHPRYTARDKFFMRLGIAPGNKIPGIETIIFHEHHDKSLIHMLVVFDDGHTETRTEKMAMFPNDDLISKFIVLL